MVGHGSDRVADRLGDRVSDREGASRTWARDAFADPALSVRTGMSVPCRVRRGSERERRPAYNWRSSPVPRRGGCGRSGSTTTSAMLTECEKTEEPAFLGDVSSVPLQWTPRHLQTAFTILLRQAGNVRTRASS